MAALAQKRCIFDPKLIKPKCVCLHLPAVCLQFSIKLPPLKHILALPTKVQKCTFSELQPFTIVIFQMVHPVLNRKKMNIIHSYRIFTSTRKHLLYASFGVTTTRRTPTTGSTLGMMLIYFLCFIGIRSITTCHNLVYLVPDRMKHVL